MVRVMETGKSDKRSHNWQVFTSLFQLRLSGTHASIEQRLEVLGWLLRSCDSKQRMLGLAALRRVLESSYFSSVGNFDFWGLSRDHGYWPRTANEVRHWFVAALELVESFACSDDFVSPDARLALAERFRGLWHNAGVCEELAGSMPEDFEAVLLA